MAKQCTECQVVNHNNNVRKCGNCGHNKLVKFDLEAEVKNENDIIAELEKKNRELEEKLERLSKLMQSKEEKKKSLVEDKWKRVSVEKLFQALKLEEFVPTWHEHLIAENDPENGVVRLRVEKEFYKKTPGVKKWLGLVQQHCNGLLVKKDEKVYQREAVFRAGALCLTSNLVK